jgi:FSR family fosmidomycin resistance protein-like MFS transporter
MTQSDSERGHGEGSAFTVLVALSFCHCLNDLIQSLIPSIYPIIKQNYGLDFAQIGLVTLTFQLTASLLQPAVGMMTDRKPRTWSLPFGMGMTLIGLLLFSRASHYGLILLAAGLVGTGSSIFHPESSRIARLASGGRHGLAQSIFQVGGNAGSSVGPLLAAFIVLPYGQRSIAWFSLVAILAIVVLSAIARWYRTHGKARAKAAAHALRNVVPREKVGRSMAILLSLVFSKHVYLASLTSYYTFYLIERFHLSVRAAQIDLFIFLASVAVGTIVGGPIGDRIGRKRVIWVSILGILPFTLVLPHVGLTATVVLTVIIGLVLASAFPAILVYAQDLVPGKVGTVAGLFFGLAFGIAGIAAAVLGALADVVGIVRVYELCSFLPLIGLLTAFLPEIGQKEVVATA